MEPFLVRDQPLASLTQFSSALAGAFASATPETEKALGEALFGECIQCGISVNGSELARVCGQDANAAPEDKLSRLRLGYCARKGCNGHTYRLKFYKHIDLKWDDVLARIEGNLQVQQDEIDEAAGVVQEVKREEHLRSAKKFFAFVTVCLVLLILRQLFMGGAIPFIREPEKFQVAPRTNTVPEFYND